MSDQPLRVAIIGSGPSGFYAADALLKNERQIHVDMFDRLPTPYGLVRGGVAPDHQSIKAVIKLYEKISNNPRFRFFGNVTLGKDLIVEDLSACYDQWIYAVGNEKDRRLGIPGEDLAGSHSATDLVGWYNAHPDHCDRSFDLSCERVAVVGVGNVAMDVTRILLQTPDELAKTDISGPALEALRNSKIREVVVLGRRGVAQAAFSPPEIKEIGELAGTDVVVLPDEVVIDPASEPDLEDANTRKNVDYCTAKSALGEGTNPKKVRLRFLASPVEILGEGGRVSAIRIERNRLEGSPDGAKARGTGVFETIPVGLVFRSVGYRGSHILGVPFDEKRGIIPNEAGRVKDADGAIRPREYVVGWAKRGPSGLIGTNRGDSIATVQAMLQEQASLTPNGVGDQEIVGRLRDRGVRSTSFADWKRIDTEEVARGKAAGKLREKFSRVDEMLGLL